MAAETRSDVEWSGETSGPNPAVRYGATLIALAFAGVGAFGVAIAVRLLRGEGVIESGVDIGTTTAELAAFNPALPHYIVHIRTAAAGMFIAVGLLGAVIAWYGVRRGRRWGLASAIVAPVVGTGVGVPMHYSSAFHVDQGRHLGPAYASLVVFVGGTIVAFRGLGTDGGV